MEQVTATQSVALRVRDAMESAGRSARSLATETAIPHVTLARRLSGAVPFRVDELDRIAAALGVTTASFFGERAA